MDPKLVDDVQSPPKGAAGPPVQPVPFVKLALAFLAIGATTFGGMWGATQKLEHELVQRRRWLTLEEQHALMVAATLIPAPRFLAFGGMVGFRLHGWIGSILAIATLLTAPALLVVLGVALFTPEVMGSLIIPLRRAVGVGIVGLLLGNAFLQLKGSKVKGRERAIGLALAAAVAATVLAGVPLIVAAVAGFTVGAFFIRTRGRD